MRTYDTARTGASHRARRLRRDATAAERHLLLALREALPSCKWRHQMPIGPYIVDIACFAERLVIELDGGQHADAVVQDAARTSYIERQGYRVIRFWNDEALTNTDGVLTVIADQLSSSPSHAFGAGPTLSHGRGKISGD